MKKSDLRKIFEFENKVETGNENERLTVMFFLAKDKGIAALPLRSLCADLLITGQCQVVMGSKLHEASPFSCRDNFEGSK